MPQNQNMARAGPIKKIPTGKQVVQPEPEPEPEPELFTLDQLLVAQIIEGLNCAAFKFQEGDPSLTRLFQAKMCLIDYAGLEILNTLEQEAANRQAMMMAQIEEAQRQQAMEAAQAAQVARPRRRPSVGQQVEEEFKTTGEVVKGLVSDDESEGDEPGEEIPAEEQVAEGEVTEGDELPGDEGPVDPFDQDILSDPDAALPGLADVPHIGGKKKLPTQPKVQQDGPETRESKNLINRILKQKEKDGSQKGKPAPAKPQKETIDSVG